MIGQTRLLGAIAATAAMLFTLGAPSRASAQVYRSGCNTAYSGVTYVSYQPSNYRPVYTSRPVVYTAPARPTYVQYSQPVREVVRYVPQPVTTRTVYVQPSCSYSPRVVVYGSSGYSHSHYRPHFYRSSGHHGNRGFHLNVGRRHGGFSVSYRR